MPLIDDVADVFCVGPQPLSRWRPYVSIDADGKLQPPDWTPQAENERMIRKKHWHARCAVQYSVLAEHAAECGWEVEGTLKAFLTCAVLDMRYQEICLLDFQLLTQSVGIDNRTTDRDELYLTAKMVHSTHLFLHDVTAKCTGIKKSGRKEVLQEAPSAVDGKVQLARCICNGVRAIKAYYEPAFAAMRARYEGGDAGVEQDMDGLVKRMKMVMMQLDRVVVILGDDPRCDKLSTRCI